jgi:hypothetical protein
MHNSEQITYFAQTDARNRRLTFGIKAKDRTKHVYLIGKTGMGKSTVLENMAVQDLRNGNGFAFLDPHGSAIETILEYIPKERMNDVIYFAPFDMEHPISFNVMEDVGYDKRHLVVSGLMSTFKKIWQDAWSARMEYILGNTLLALLEYPDSTLLEVNKMLVDKDFRNKVVSTITDPSVKSFWVDEFAKYTDRFAAEATPAIQNKIGQFTANPLIRNIIGQPVSSFDLRKVMDERKILLINLSKGRIGESNGNLLGSMLITKIYLAAMSRADVALKDMQELPNFYLYVDEFQSFANETFADILSEARKYKLNLTIAHQYIEQMSEEVRAAVFGNVGTMITFRVGSYDAEVLEKELAPVFTAEDIVNLGFAQIYLRLMIDGIGSQPFSATTLPPLERPENNLVDEIMKLSRQKYTRPRAEVEDFIKKVHSENQNNNNQKRDDKESANDNFKNDNFRKDNGRKAINQNQKNRIEKKINSFQEKKDLPEYNDKSDLGSISLQDLTIKTVRDGGDKKKPTEENKNELKNALAAILGDLKGRENVALQNDGGEGAVNGAGGQFGGHFKERGDSGEKFANKFEGQFKGSKAKSVLNEKGARSDKEDDDNSKNNNSNISQQEIAESELRKLLGI